jgi:Flp pilus assembly secretin CpaC
MSLLLKRQTLDIAALALAASLAGMSVARAETLNLPLGHATRVGVAGPATAIVVGSPSVADVTVVDSRTLFITGRSYGSTNIVALNRFGQVVFSGDVVVSPSSSVVKVYRGAARTELACAPGCSPTEVRSGAPAGAGDSPKTPADMASGMGGANIAAGVANNLRQAAPAAGPGVGMTVTPGPL